MGKLITRIHLAREHDKQKHNITASYFMSYTVQDICLYAHVFVLQRMANVVWYMSL